MQKRILITGASSGMGHETAKDLIKKRHIVYCAARHTDKMKDLEKLGARLIHMDMSKEDTIKKGVNKIIKEQGGLDVLWNNAGYGLYGPVEEISIKKAKEQFEVNLFGLARLTQLVLPHMRKQKSGLIINTSSMGGKMYTPLGAWYHATKHALEGWSDCLRIEVKQFGINVVILEPGLISTGFGAGVMKNFDYSKGPYKKMVNAMLKGAFASVKGSHPKVISNTVQKIISSKKPKTRYVTGKMAKPLLFFRRWFSDRLFDKMVMRMVK